MRTLLAALAVCFLAAADNASDAVKKELKQLEGEWSMVSGERDGHSLPADFIKVFKRVCKDDETTVTVGDEIVLKAKFSIDRTKKPKTIDYTVLEGPNQGKKQLGIYELDGDHLRFCTAPFKSDRPTSFTTHADNGWTRFSWKRVKK